MIVYIESLDDPRVEDFVRLTDVNLRKRLETLRGLYMAESSKVIERALQEGHEPRAFFTSPRHLPALQDIAQRLLGASDAGEIPIYLGSDEMMQHVTGFKVHRGALASFNRPQLAEVGELLASARGGKGARRIIVLEGLVDHTNVGAIFRSCAALGVDAILVTDTCADPLYRRSVRVSMGTVFQVPWTRIYDWPRSMNILHDEGFTTAALALEDDALPLDKFSALDEVQALNSRVALIMGTEGDGLGKRTIANADYRVIIPMAGRVDSLNVAAASAVACWELRVRDEGEKEGA
ncbi:TrmH family RNA methyltransferase [Actinotignum urinale]|uniref:RNA methyltransferase n=1 Tax=Actinotignum urinale TaxID=190146 RepID=A0AAW9HKM8_9ACTO|nr:RNA methyltransferase [Actinotignum urinale]MDY5154473.1 RNA methyltransferase [Actinotignum urinale]